MRPVAPPGDDHRPTNAAASPATGDIGTYIDAARSAQSDRLRRAAELPRAVGHRFVKITDAEPTVDWDPVERARYLAGLKNYATNTPPRR